MLTVVWIVNRSQGWYEGAHNKATASQAETSAAE
jgi:hypothetical protein